MGPPSTDQPSVTGYAANREELLLVLAERMSRLQKDVDIMGIKLDRSVSEQATRTAITDLAVQVKEYRDTTEKRIAILEHWKTGIESQVKLVYVFAALISFAFTIVGRYWKP